MSVLVGMNVCISVCMVNAKFSAGGASRKTDWSDRRWSQSSCNSVKSYMEREYPHTAQPIHRHTRRHSRLSDYDDSPTVAEMTLPWRRDLEEKRRDLAQNLANNRFRKCYFSICLLTAWSI